LQCLPKCCTSGSTLQYSSLHYQGVASTGIGDVDTKFVTCGSTAEEAIKGHKELMEEWEKFLEKEAKGPYRDRRKLK